MRTFSQITKMPFSQLIQVMTIPCHHVMPSSYSCSQISQKCKSFNLIIPLQEQVGTSDNSFLSNFLYRATLPVYAPGPRTWWGLSQYLLNPAFLFVRGKKSKVTQGKVAFPGQLQLLRMKPKKATIDFCSLLPKCGNALSEYRRHIEKATFLAGSVLCSLCASAVN